MKALSKLSVKIIAAIVIGFLLAGAGTKITYTCTPAAGEAGCISFDKALMHPSDLVHNKQNSLAHFSEVFVITSLASFAIFSFISSVQGKSKSVTRPKD